MCTHALRCCALMYVRMYNRHKISDLFTVRGLGTFVVT